MLNKAILMGRLTRDPELRHTQTQIPVTTFTIAVDRPNKKTALANDPNAQTCDFFDIVAWQNTAEFVTKWFRKGMQVAVSGRLQQRSWVDNQGNKRTTIEVRAEDVHFADTRRDNTGGGDGNPPPYGMPYAPSAQRDDAASGVSSPGVGGLKDVPPADSDGFADLAGDDDLPF